VIEGAGAGPRSRLNLRSATRDDLAELVRLVRALAEYERLVHQARGTEADFDAALFGPRPAAHAVIAEWDGRIAGFAIWFTTFSTFAARRGLWVEDVFVEEDLRGFGIGHALFRHMAQEAVALGCARMEWSVLDWNEPARHFYRRIGAEPLDDWTIQRLAGEALRNLAG
jgi:GNAT superfamily N-acetyltransferase